MDLTPKQRAVLQFLKDYRREHGMPPSYDEIRREFGFASLNSARKHLLQLHRKGFIRSPWKNQKRALEIVEAHEVRRVAALPLVGSVAAGKPLLSEEADGAVEVPEAMLRRGEHVAFRVRGDSMIEDGIRDGDLLVVQRRPDAEVGQTVVALVDGEATVKRYYRSGDKVELRPANERFTPLLVDPSSLHLEGVVVGLVRTFA
jgi:repressor LexA